MFAVYPGMCHFKFTGRVFAKSRNFYKYNMVSIYKAKGGGGLEKNVWIVRGIWHNNEKTEKKLIAATKIRNLHFIHAVYNNKNILTIE